MWILNYSAAACVLTATIEELCPEIFSPAAAANCSRRLARSIQRYSTKPARPTANNAASGAPIASVSMEIMVRILARTALRTDEIRCPPKLRRQPPAGKFRARQKNSRPSSKLREELQFRPISYRCPHYYTTPRAISSVRYGLLAPVKRLFRLAISRYHDRTHRMPA